ncbi:hypothetical protein [Pannonibacter sp. SL95]|uniref:hypothetical protein n=1 Tax=Pannonibacter sp. SL95 TaxID=2995153 RepID=UPI00227256E0|nr:hypothetical protein [Pannonibacter sp. SL95]MCY1706496.1 hypothetical protein [Pannonibacter sp. SL95]
MSIEKGARKARDRSDFQETLKISACRPQIQRVFPILRRVLQRGDCRTGQHGEFFQHTVTV